MHHGEHVVERQQQGRAHGHGDRPMGGRQLRLQAVRSVAANVGAIVVPPLPHSLLGDPVALRHHPQAGSVHAWIAARIFASSSPACEERSASSPTVPNLAQHRSCHEQRQAASVYAIILHAFSSPSLPSLSNLRRLAALGGQKVCPPCSPK